ncbi:MAG TPA: DUF177 domain-containing protein [Candidatus Binatia bacterium]|nr:DUF177 domain-containing protein [Candidatus Binatia bacterium]
MKIALDDIKATPKTLAYTEEVDELNGRLARGASDWRVPDGPAVDVEYYRSGLDVFFRGAVHGRVLGTCARCLEEYPFALDHPFVFVLTPRAAAVGGARLSADDLALSFYEGEEIDLTPLVHEQVILALPTRPLCDEHCRGLCPRCGTNLNVASCDCPAAMPDARLAALHALARGNDPARGGG